MMKTILTAVCFLIASMSASYSFSIIKTFTPNNVKSVKVEIYDGAKEGCWTNLGEVKRYAEDKLELAGYRIWKKSDIDAADQDRYYLSINVNSGRGNGCYGAVDFKIYRIHWIDEIYGHFTVGDGITVFSGQKNANQLVLESLRSFLKKLPK